MGENNSDPEAIKVLTNSFIQEENDSKESKDIRSEIISDMLLICLGLSPKLLEKVKEPAATPKINFADPLNLRERFDKIIENVMGGITKVYLPTSQDPQSSEPVQVKPAEYDSRAREILFKIAGYLEFSPAQVIVFEDAMAQQLYLIQQEAQAESGDAHKQLQEHAKETLEKHSKRKRAWRLMATSMGVVVGATAIGFTGGLAAPWVALGLGAITGGFFLTSSSLVLITGLFGIYGGGLAGYKMHKRTGGVKEFAFTHFAQDPDLPSIPSLYVNIVISGYLYDSDEEITTPWIPAFERGVEYHDTYALAFDPEILRSLGKAFKRFITEHAVKFAAHEVIKHTVLGLLTTAMSLPISLAKAGDLIDNPWALGMDRASKAGLILADVLIERVQGKRPAVLIGYSLGALVIWECLQELSRRKEYGLIDSVIFIGAPIPAKPADKWELASSVVSRRIINAYGTNDIILAVVFRLHNPSLNVAGLEAVNSPRVENFDITELTKSSKTGHLAFHQPEVITKILQKVGLE